MSDQEPDDTYVDGAGIVWRRPKNGRTRGGYGLMLQRIAAARLAAQSGRNESS